MELLGMTKILLRKEDQYLFISNGTSVEAKFR
uniref:Uncharacterized protein n=1 Tax=Arundo donax TaxID=35708 RepID=A0A0A9H4K4_ARUDO